MVDPGRRFPKLNREWSGAKNEQEIEFSEVGLAILRISAAFGRWNEASCVAVGGPNLTAPEINCLHVIAMQSRAKTAATVANLLNRDDQANIQYGLRKMRALGLIQVRPGGNKKNYEYEVTEQGKRLTDDLSDIAREIVYRATGAIDDATNRFVSTSDLLRILTGIWDESARVAATFSVERPDRDKPVRVAAAGAAAGRSKGKSGKTR